MVGFIITGAVVFMVGYILGYLIGTWFIRNFFR